MRLLLDTHTLLWWLLDDPELPAAPRLAIESADAVFVSAASVWEIAIKQRLGKLPELRFAVTELPGLIRDGHFIPLPVDERHAAAVGALPLHHRDPFDHLLIAQALSEQLTLVSRDRQFAAYGVKLRW